MDEEKIKIDCICGGENEKCYKCDGKGYYYNEPSLYISASAKTNLGVPSKNKFSVSGLLKRTYEELKEIHKEFRKKRKSKLKGPIEQSKSSEWENKFPKSSKNLQHKVEAWIKRKEKKRLIKADKNPIEKGGNKFMLGEIETFKKIIPSQPIQINNEIKNRSDSFCPLCNCAVKKENLEKHYRKCSEKIKMLKSESNNNFLFKSNSSKKNKRKKNKKHHNGTSIGKLLYDKPILPNQKEERKLDATRDYWGYRETGKFGSHSSHDDFGDESSS